MSIKRIFTITTALVLFAGTTRAAHVWEDPGAWWSGNWSSDANVPKYTAQELSLDLFGSYINPEGKLNDLFDTNIRHGFWGGGAGLNYFLTRNLGLGADFNMSSKTSGNLVDDVVGDVTLRLPLGNSGLAPYLIGSGGRGFSDLHGGNLYQWVYGGGVGLEFRWSPTMGVFSDARFFWGDKGTAFDRLLIRAGLRVVF